MSDIGIALTNGSVQVEGPWIDTTCQLRDTIAPLIESEITTGITFTLKKQVCQLLSTEQSSKNIFVKNSLIKQIKQSVECLYRQGNQQI